MDPPPGYEAPSLPNCARKHTLTMRVEASNLGQRLACLEGFSASQVEIHDGPEHLNEHPAQFGKGGKQFGAVPGKGNQTVMSSAMWGQAHASASGAPKGGKPGHSSMLE